MGAEKPSPVPTVIDLPWSFLGEKTFSFFPLRFRGAEIRVNVLSLFTQHRSLGGTEKPRNFKRLDFHFFQPSRILAFFT